MLKKNAIHRLGIKQKKEANCLFFYSYCLRIISESQIQLETEVHHHKNHYSFIQYTLV